MSFKFHLFARNRVDEMEFESVQGQAVQGVFRGPVFLVSGNGVTYFLHVYPDLVFTSGFETQFHERELSV